jgi:hypothetical protein
VLVPTREKASLSWVGFHAFRHACATILARGNNAEQVQHWLGHHSGDYTLAAYVQLGDGDMGEGLTVPTGVAESAPAAIAAQRVHTKWTIPPTLGAIRAESLDVDSALRSPFSVSAPLRSPVRAP